MKITLVAIISLTFVSNLYAWDFGIKGNVQTTSTDNVNLTETTPISDNYLTFGGYVQAKDDSLKFKLKAKTEKYNKQKENDNYSADLSAQYKKSKESEFTFGVFKQTYNGTPLVSTDSTSDNSGARLSGTFSKQYEKETSGSFTLSGTYKKYSKIANRTDKIIGATLGLEHNFSKTWMINPELNFQNTNSADSYYSNFTYGPSVILSFTPNDDWEFFADANFGHTNYSGRTVTTIVKGKPVSHKEYQELFSADVGVLYNFAKAFALQGKYSKGKNISNNSTSAYKANSYSVDLSLRF